MRSAVPILTLGLLACMDSGSQPPQTDLVRARFPAGGIADVIEIDAADRLPLRKAELISPDGLATPAAYLSVTPSPSITSYHQFPNGPYAGNASGVGNIAAGVPLSALSTGAPQQRAEVLTMISIASIPLPDPVEYRQDWRSYRIRLGFGDPPGEVEIRELVAPQPPPGG